MPFVPWHKLYTIQYQNMGKVTFLAPVDAVSGKLNKKSNVYFRVVNGQRYAVLMVNPRTRNRSSEKEKAYRATVGSLSKEASCINRDDTLAAPYNDWKAHGYSTRYRYILSELIRTR